MAHWQTESRRHNARCQDDLSRAHHYLHSLLRHLHSCSGLIFNADVINVYKLTEYVQIFTVITGNLYEVIEHVVSLRFLKF